MTDLIERRLELPATPAAVWRAAQKRVVKQAAE